MDLFLPYLRRSVEEGAWHDGRISEVLLNASTTPAEGMVIRLARNI